MLGKRERRRAQFNRVERARIEEGIYGIGTIGLI